MNWTQPVAVTIPATAFTAWRRLALFFGHYDCRVYLTASAYLDVGAGSLYAAQHVTNIPEGFSGSIGTVGRHCEFSPCEIMAAGEHRNDEPVNIGFSGGFPLLAQVARAAGFQALVPAKPISIGNAVVISSGVKIMSGVSIGDCAVIGAGAIVTRDVEPFAIVAGVPAREIRKRLDPQSCEAVKACAWWDWEPAILLQRAATLQADATTYQGAKRPDRPRFVIHLEGPQNPKLVGFASGSDIMAFSAAPASVQAYVANAMSDNPTAWMADCWA